MIEEKYLDLIHKEIDGLSTKSESAELSAYLANNLEAQDLYRDLATISRILNNVREVDPPPYLRTNILNSIPSSRYTRKEKRSSLSSVIQSLVVGGNARYAYAVVAGVVLGILAYAVISREIDGSSSSEISTLYGTMLSQEASESLEAGEHVEISLEQAHGTVDIKYSNEIVLVELSLESDQEIDMVIEFDDGDVSFAGFRQLDSPIRTLSIEKSSLRVTNAGNHEYILVFSDQTESISPMSLKVFSEGPLLYEQTVSTGLQDE
ncbi:MAG: hypothetical protein ACE5H0_06305 [Bacteroidota bacterium]